MVRQFVAEVEVAAPAEEVWAVITDWPSHGEWMLGTRVAVVEGDGASAGSRLFAFTGVVDIGFLDTLEIIDWEPPRLCRVRHLGTLLRGTAEFVVSPRGTGVTVRWVERLRPPFGPLGVVGLSLAGPLLRWGMRRSLHRLAARCAER